MARKTKDDPKVNEADIESADDEPFEGQDYVSRKALRADAADIYDDVVEGFNAKKDRDEENARYWDIYNLELSDEQSYIGTSDVYLPIVRDAIEARTLRYINTLFPVNSRFVECISNTNDNAHALQALLNFYVRYAKLRDTMSACLRAADVTGQYSLYAGWTKKERKILQRVKKPVAVELDKDLSIEVPEDVAEATTEVEEVTLTMGSPDVWVIPDEDLCVLPSTVDEINDADVVAVAIRCTKSWFRERKKEFNSKQYKHALALFEMKTGMGVERPNPEKKRSADAGVKSDKGVKMLLIYEIWASMEIEGEWLPVVIRAAGPGPENILSIKKNPFWGQRCPVISAPVKKVAGSFWGVSPTKGVAKLAYQANDAVNMGMDSAQFALCPIVMTNPLSNPRVSTMVLEMAALWEVNPNDTKILEFPKLWQDAFQIVAGIKAQIHESLGLNPAMMPSGATKKTSQAAVAQEQAIALESTSDSISVLEGTILTDLANRIFEYDQQYRDKPMDIPHFGELGYEAEQETVPPVEMGTRYSFLWAGRTQQQNQQKVQQMIAGMNVLRGIPPNQMEGRRLDIGPILDSIVDIIYGPRLGPRVLKDMRSALGIAPSIENEMMRHNMPAVVNPLDNDVAHLQSHMAAMQVVGDPTGIFMAHIQQHQQALAAKGAQMAPGGAQGVPGGAGPGVAGTPRPGAQPAGPRGVAQQPPGAVRPGQMSDPARMPAGHA